MPSTPRPFLLSFLLLLIFSSTGSAVVQDGKIAFTSDRDGNLEIYTMNADGTNQVRITNNPGTDDFPTWSPNGRRIAFLSEDTVVGGFYIKLMNPDGGNRVTLTSIGYLSIYPWHSYWSMSWSPDGTRIAFEDNDDIFVMDADGSNRTNITNRPGFDESPSWSPDGSRIIFSSDLHPFFTMHTMTPTGGDVQVLPSADDFWDTVPTWSPTGNKIAFIMRHEDYLPIIYTANADGTDRQIFDWCNAGQQLCSTHRNKPRWSPDGTKILFHIWEYFSDDSEIYVKTLGASGSIRLTNTVGKNFNASWQPIVTGSTLADFDGDGRTDVSIFRPSDGRWWVQRSTDSGVNVAQFGLGSDKVVAADYTGDGKTDIAIYRPSTGEWFVLRSEDSSYYAVPFGQSSDLPAPADFDGDARVDLAVFRPSTGVWYIQRSTGGVTILPFGANGDVPVVDNYDNDNRADVAIWRPSSGEWWINRSASGVFVSQLGAIGDVPVNADYTGDGKADLAVYRPASGTWFIVRSENMSGYPLQFGASGDVPVAGDFDGDGKVDVAIFRPSSGQWWTLRSATGSVSVTPFGTNGDVPISHRD